MCTYSDAIEQDTLHHATYIYCICASTGEDTSDSEGEQRHQLRGMVRRFLDRPAMKRPESEDADEEGEDDDIEMALLCYLLSEGTICPASDPICGFKQCDDTIDATSDNFPKSTGTQTSSAVLVDVATQTRVSIVDTEIHKKLA